MHSCIFLYPVDASLGRSAIFGLALASAALLRVDQRGRFSSNIFPGVSITVGYLPYVGIIYFYKVLFQYLDLCNNIKYYYPLLRVPLSIFDVWHFPEEAPKFLENSISLSISAWAAEFLFRPTFSAISSLISRFLISSRLSSGVLFGLLGILFLCSTWVTGDPKFSYGLLQNCERCPGNPSPCLLFFSSRDGEGLAGIFSLLSDGIIFSAIFSHFMWGG